jgi:hypothetical protein
MSTQAVSDGKAEVAITEWNRGPGHRFAIEVGRRSPAHRDARGANMRPRNGVSYGRQDS